MAQDQHLYPVCPYTDPEKSANFIEILTVYITLEKAFLRQPNNEALRNNPYYGVTQTEARYILFKDRLLVLLSLYVSRRFLVISLFEDV